MKDGVSMTTRAENDEIEEYLGTLHISVQSVFRKKSTSKLLKEARNKTKKADDAADVAAAAETAAETAAAAAAATAAAAADGVLNKSGKKRRRSTSAPSARTVPLPRLADAPESGKVNASSLMTKDQQRLHLLASAHFAAATKKLENVGGGELRLLWKQKMSVTMHGDSGSTEPFELPYSILQTPADVLKCRDAEKGEFKIHKSVEAPSNETHPQELQISGLRYI